MVEEERNPGVFEGMLIEGITGEQVIGKGPGIPEKKMGETSYCLVALNGLEQKFLAIVEEGNSRVELIEVEDVEEAGEEMFKHVGRRLGLKVD